jgi:hypothetical protein
VWQSLGPWLASGGGVGIAGAVSYLVYRLHRDAVQAYKDLAAAQERIADAERQRANLREQQLGIMLGQVSGRVSGSV